MTRRLTISAALVAALIAMPGATATVKGNVSFEGQRLPGTTVTMFVDGRTITKITDARGEFRFEDVPARTGEVTAELTAFLPAKKTFAIANERAEVRMSFALRMERQAEPATIACGPLRYEQGATFTMLQTEAANLPLSH